MPSTLTAECPVCGSTRAAACPFGGYLYDGREMPLVRCAKCSLMYVIHRMTERQFADFYNDPRYFDSEYAGGVEASYANNRAEMEKKASRVLSIVRRFKPHGSFLDVGCAGGYLLEVARESFGYAVMGIEISENMSAAARARGLDVFTGSVEQIPHEWGKFDVVYMGDVLEHIPTLGPFMDAVKAHMGDRALIVLELPLTYNLTLSGIVIGLVNMCRGRFGRRYFLPAQHRHGLERKPPYHVLMFDRRSIREFFRREGFTVRYLKIYEGEPKPKYRRTWYGRLKWITHRLTYHIYQQFLGDRMMVIAEKT